MIFPWWPVIGVDVVGSLLILTMAFYCIVTAREWSQKSPNDPFKHYIFMLTLTIAVFAISRGIGHVVKQALLASGHSSLWKTISPYSSAVNTATFIMIAAFSIYFNRQNKIKQQFRETAIDLETTRTNARLASESETRLLSIFNNMDDAVYLIDSSYRICFFNRKLQTMLPACAVDSLCYEIIMERESPCPRCRMHEVIEQGRIFNKETYLPGLKRIFNMTEIPITWINGKKVKLNVGRDITEQRQLEEQLRHSQKMEAIGTLAGGVAHDINNALTPIVGYAELMLLTLPPDNPLIPKIQHIQKSARRATELISRILAYSRRQVIKKEKRDINKLINDTSEMFTSLLEENITLDLQLLDQPLPVNIDHTQFEQVLANLVVNARDAMPQGGLLLLETMLTDHEEIICQSCGEKTAGPHALIMVSDNGAGMDQGTVKRIFEPYFTTKALEKGTGLGLAMVHGIIHQHGGHINVYSEQGMGTTFKIYLPLAPDNDETLDNSPIGRHAMTHATMSGHETILVVEDDDQVRRITAECLEEFGYEVLLAETGKKALEISRTADRKIDLLLTDVIMPDTNGRMLAEQMKEIRPQIRILFMSGYTDNVIAQHGVLGQDVHFLGKPFSPEGLAQKVREALG